VQNATREGTYVAADLDGNVSLSAIDSDVTRQRGNGAPGTSGLWAEQVLVLLQAAADGKAGAGVACAVSTSGLSIGRRQSK
jgi:hypothetical protein